MTSSYSTKSPTNHQVFISYVHENQETVYRIYKYLSDNGIKVWLDKEDITPGANWKDAIRKGISNGDFFIACFSIEYNQKSSTYMNEELHLAIDELRKRSIDQTWFIPVLLSGQVPDWSLGGGRNLKDLQWVDLNSENWEKNLERILKTVKPESSYKSSESNIDYGYQGWVYGEYMNKMYWGEEARKKGVPPTFIFNGGVELENTFACQFSNSVSVYLNMQEVFSLKQMLLERWKRPKETSIWGYKSGDIFLEMFLTKARISLPNRGFSITIGNEKDCDDLLDLIRRTTTAEISKVELSPKLFTINTEENKYSLSSYESSLAPLEKGFKGWLPKEQVQEKVDINKLDGFVLDTNMKSPLNVFANSLNLLGLSFWLTAQEAIFLEALLTKNHNKSNSMFWGFRSGNIFADFMPGPARVSFVDKGFSVMIEHSVYWKQIEASVSWFLDDAKLDKDLKELRENPQPFYFIS